MTKEEIAKLNLEDLGKLFGPEVLRDNPRYNPNDLTVESVKLIKARMETLFDSRVVINGVTVERQSQRLKTTGDSREIIVNGTAGAVFTMTIKDSEECSIMEDELENVSIPSNGKYVFTQDFPSIKSTLKKEHYKITLTPQAGVILVLDSEVVLQQRAFTSITLKAINEEVATIPGAVISGGDSTLTLRESSKFVTEGSWQTSIVGSSEENPGKLYVKSVDFLKYLNRNNSVKKIAIRHGNDFTDKIINLKPLKTGIKDGIISGDLFPGMTIIGRVEKTKTVTNSLEVPNCKKKTDKFELDNTLELFEGMFVYLGNRIVASIVSVDCGRNITVSKKLIISSDTEVVFAYTSAGRVGDVIAQQNSDGNACIRLDRGMYIPHGMELEFDADKSIFSGTITQSGSGSNQISFTKEIKVKSFGAEDETHVLDVSGLVTRKPNIVDRSFSVDANSGTNYFSLTYGDNDANKSVKVYALTKQPSNGVAISLNSRSGKDAAPTLSYIPNPNFIGEDVVKYRVVYDGDNDLVDDDTAINPMSDEKTIRITVK